MAIEAYCVKCKAKKEMQDPVEGVTKNGKPITKGKCPDCGTTICRIGAAKESIIKAPQGAFFNMASRVPARFGCFVNRPVNI